MPHSHHHSIRPHSRRLSRTGRDRDFALYEPVVCYCDGVPCLCPDTGALPIDTLTVYPGWNVWDVYQVNDLPFSIMMLGVSPERQLRIWVEDSVRLGAPGATVADSVDLKGGQVEILSGPPSGLTQIARKEQLSGTIPVVSGPATLKTVRFFNRGDKATMAWPHDESYLLDAVYLPSPTNPVTSGPSPTTISQTVGSGVSQPVGDLLKSLLPIGLVIGGGLLLLEALNQTRRVKRGRSKA